MELRDSLLQLLILRRTAMRVDRCHAQHPMPEESLSHLIVDAKTL
jgi:hypothetical protein